MAGRTTRRDSPATAATQRDAWSFDAAGEWLRTDGVVVVGEEVRGPVDVPADSDYVTGFLTGGYNPGAWHATLRLGGYSEERGNGTPQQVNTTGWRQLSGEAGGSAGGGAWIVRGSGGTQEYYQTFTAVAADRASERLTTEQTTPSSFGTASGQWSRGFGAVDGARRRRGTVDNSRRSKRSATPSRTCGAARSSPAATNRSAPCSDG